MKNYLTKAKKRDIIIKSQGDMAQLVERLVRNEEASGSNPLISTTRHRIGGAFFRAVEISVYRKAELSSGAGKRRRRSV